MIEFDGVEKRYSDGTVAVHGFSATLQEHRTTVLVGSSGSGKTTLLRMINRMIAPTSGIVRIDGVDVSDRNPVTLRRGIGYVLQQGGLLPHRCVADNIALVPRLEGASRAAARARAGELLELVGLDSALADRYPAQLSGGQRQRVGVARALAADPDILLMDEPFGAVDPLVRRELQDELLRIQAGLGKTIVFVTHDVEEALRLGDRIILLRDGGRIVQDGTGPELLAGPADEFAAAFLGLTRGTRELFDHDGIVVDALGRAVGRLGTDAAPAGDGTGTTPGA